MPAQRGTNGRPLYVGPNGTVILADGAVLANGYLAYGGGNVLVDGGRLEMSGSAIIKDAYIGNNMDCYGGGVLVSGGAFYMDGGEIRNNTISTTQGFESYGGGVAVMDGASFWLSGGVISGNDVDTNGGGVYLAAGGKAVLSGTVEVSGNEAGGVGDNLFLPDLDTHFLVPRAVSGSIGVTCGEATYGVVVGSPHEYQIKASDEDAFFYDGGQYDIRLQDEDLILFWHTVKVEVNIEGATSSNLADETPVGQDYDTVLIPDDGFQLPKDITVSVGGVELGNSEYDYDPDTGAVHIPGEEVEGDINITVTADARHTITVSTTNVTADLAETVVIQKDTTVITLAAAPRYALPAESDITIDGACSHSYDKSAGRLTISNVSGDVAISIDGAEVFHTIYFDPGEGVCDTRSKQITESQPIYGALPTPARTGYTFSGWYAEETRVTGDTANHLTDDLYLIAHWTARTDIRYEVRHWLEYTDGGANPGYAGGGLHTMTHGSVERKYYLYRADIFEDGIANGIVTIVPLALADLGGGLESAGLTPSGANLYEVIMAPDGSSIYPLYYDRNAYRVSYDPNGGTLQGNAYTDLVYGGLYGALPDAARAGYTFTGWFTEAHGGAQVQAGDRYLFPGDQTLYAHWTPEGETGYVVYHLAQVLHDNSVSYDKAPENYVLTQTDNLSGTSDTTVDVYGIAVPGFVPSSDNVYSIKIEADGTAVAYLYYDRLVTDISYDAQGGTLVSTRSRLYYGGTFASLPGDPSLVGYHFLGWYTSPEPTAQRVTIGTSIESINPKGLTALTLYARWAPNPYELAFEAYGGAVSGTKSVTYGTPVDELPAATLSGYIFRGWYDAPGHLGQPEGNLVTAETIVSTDTLVLVGDDGTETAKTLHAWYEPIQVTVTFDGAPGTLPSGAAEALIMTYDKAFGSAGAFPVPAFTGYTFTGWHFDGPGGTAMTADAVCRLLADTTVYASYVPNLYEVFFDVNGGDPLEMGKTLVTYDAPFGPLPEPIRKGHAFEGWYLGEEKITADSTVQITGATTLTAHWKANNYTISFHVNGGNDLPEDERQHTVTYGDAFGSLPAPSRNGYSFQGWYTEQAAGVRITAESIMGFTSDTTLYAHWTLQGGGGGGGGSPVTEYTLTFHANGGTQLKPIRAVRNTTVKTADYTTARRDFKFLGWYFDAALKESAGASFKLTADTGLYANWALDTSAGLITCLDRENHMAYIEGMPDGTVQPTAKITRAEVAMIFYRLLRPEAVEAYGTDSSPFSDVPSGVWYGKAAATLNAMGVIHGRGSGLFAPDAKITRAEFAAIAARFNSLPYTGPDLFSDISGSWAREEINRAARAGWIHGDGSGRFRPRDLITRAEVITLVNNMLGRRVTASGLLPGARNFPDNVSGSWYYYAILEATNSHTYEMTGGQEQWVLLTP